MSTEALMLLLSVFLGIAQILLAVAFATKTYGLKWNLSPRDSKMPSLDGVAARLSRAAENFKETFPFFAVVTLLIITLQKTNETTAIAAQMYFWSRVVYVPIYALGITHLRTVVWGISLVSILVMCSALF